MGYYISTHQSSFSIRTEDFSRFFALVQELMSDESIDRLGFGGRYADGKKFESWFSWVVTEDVRQACVDRDIRRVFAEWGYDLDFVQGYGEASAFSLEIRDGGAKLGDEEKFFAAIAPVVVSGSFLDCQGENNEDWRWLWENGKFFSREVVRTEIVHGEPIEIKNKGKQ